MQPAGDDTTYATVDAISTPMLTDGSVAGSLTFFSAI